MLHKLYISGSVRARVAFAVLLLCAILLISGAPFGILRAEAFEGASEIESSLSSVGLMSSNVTLLPKGGLYEGNISANGKRSGTGTYTWPNGDSYKGNWVKGRMSGKGVYRFANGAKLIGSFKDNSFKTGSYKAKTKTGSFEVVIKKGAMKSATIKLVNGFRYKGSFSKGKLSGKGTLRFASGAKYAGAFANGKRSGRGTYTWKSGAKYKGSWKNDLMNGSGTFYYTSNSKAKKLVGTFSKNHPKGTCKYVLKSGKKYKTFWKNGKCVKVS